MSKINTIVNFACYLLKKTPLIFVDITFDIIDLTEIFFTVSPCSRFGF